MSGASAEGTVDEADMTPTAGDGKTSPAGAVGVDVGSAQALLASPSPSPNGVSNNLPFGENLARTFNFRRIDSVDNSTAEDRTSMDDINKDVSREQRTV